MLRLGGGATGVVGRTRRHEKGRGGRRVTQNKIGVKWENENHVRSRHRALPFKRIYTGGGTARERDQMGKGREKERGGRQQKMVRSRRRNAAAVERHPRAAQGRPYR